MRLLYSSGFALSTLANGLRLPNAISSNMVLQREPLAPRLWGFGDASEVIHVSLNGVTTTTTADANGNWVVELEKQPASHGKTIEITSSVGDNVSLSNVAFGDVYLCSGQSNMEFSTNDAMDAEHEIADSVNYPDLRFYTIKDTAADSPQLDGKSKSDYQWGISAPSSFVPVGGSGFSYVSATCYFFGRDLYKALDGKVPIGLVASDWGGQRVECFSSPDALADDTCGGTQSSNGASMPDTSDVPPPRPYTAVERLSLDGFDDGPVPNPANSQLWYGQIYPFLNMRFTGAVWYQGEANAGDPDSYACRFPAMITDWRVKFDLPQMSFFFVQLAAFSSDYSEIRNAQMAALNLPLTGYAAAIDLGDPHSPRGSIHPRRKQEVGRRLALSCQKVQYGMEVVSTGPVFESFTADSSSLTINFKEGTSAGMHLAGTAECTTCCDSGSPFEVQVAPGYGWRATGTPAVHGSTVTASLSLNEGESAVGIRFDWTGYPQCALYNGVGGPDDHTGIAATPFREQKPIPMKSWYPVFRQTTPGVWTRGVLNLNADDESADMFARLDELESLLAEDGILEFKMRWADPDSSETNHWKQSSNPVANAMKKVSGVEGYEAIDVKQTVNGFGGLEYNANGVSLLDGEPGSANWYYALGTRQLWSSGLPAYSRAAKCVELFVMNPKTSKWTIVFRQTIPHLWDMNAKNPWNVNSDDPHSEMYSILDQLEQFRGSDGKFEFKMMWPDRWNVWSQNSNPASPGSVTGYAPIDVQHTGNNFGGLEWYDVPGTTMIDGSIGLDKNWFYAIGCEVRWGGGQNIPAFDGTGANQVELFVNRAKTKTVPVAIAV